MENSFRNLLVAFLILLLTLTGCGEPESKAGAVDTISGYMLHTLPEPDSITANDQVRTVAFLVYRFDSLNGRLPASFQELSESSPIYTGPDSGVPDPWGRTIRLLVLGDSFTIRSLGKDGIAGTHDDIAYHGVQGEGIAAMRKK